MHKTDVFDRGLPVLVNIRSDDLARVANEEAIGHLAQPIARDFREEMMRHLLLIKNEAAIRNRSGQVRNDFPPVSLACCNHFLRTRVIGARFLQIKSIERLIDDEGIGAISPSPHHRGGDVARSRPHGDPRDRQFTSLHAISFVSEKKITSRRYSTVKVNRGNVICSTPKFLIRTFRQFFVSLSDEL